MIVYDNTRCFGYAQYFHIFGSAVFTWRCLPQACIGCILGIYGSHENEYFREIFSNPTAYFSGMTLVMGFLLVFRSQLAYARYWEGRTSMQVLISKLEDVGIHTKTFVQAEDPEAIKWKSSMAHMLINYLALSIAELRGETDVEAIVSKYRINLQDGEKDALKVYNYRTFMAMSWIIDAWVARSVEQGKLTPPAPVQSRTYQIISEAQLAFNAAQKIQSTPFPYPLVQVCGMLLNIYMLSAPLVIGSYLHFYAMGAALSAFSVLGFFALNKTAEELEDPFGNDPNDLPLDHYLRSFRSSMFALGLVKSSSRASSSDEGKSTNSKPNSKRNLGRRASFREVASDAVDFENFWREERSVTEATQKGLTMKGFVYLS